MIVTPEPPVKAVNSEQVATATIARPPGSQPMSAALRRTRRAAARLSLSTYPANVKSGIASRIGVSAMP